MQRILTNPGVLLFLALTVVALVAERSLLGSGPLGGGVLLPAWGGAAGLWHEYLQGFHPVGIGSADSAPPYLAVVAVLATLLGGKPWLAVDVILLGCVPLAGVTAFLAVRRVTRSTPVRVWAAASYALLPVATGTIAAGRLGTAVVFVLLPVIALLAGRMLTQPGRRARRAAWATGLTIAVAAAFVPLVWVVALIAALALIAVRPALWRNLAIVAVVPPVLLLPWTIQVASDPSALLLEVGLQQPGLAMHDLPARSMMLLSPGGPGIPPVWVTAGIAFVGPGRAAAEQAKDPHAGGLGRGPDRAPGRGGRQPHHDHADRRRSRGIGLAGRGPADRRDGPAARGRDRGRGAAARRPGPVRRRWRAAARSGAEGAGQRTLRNMGVPVLAAVACSAPVLAAVSWVSHGVRGPVAPVAGPVVPAVISASPESDLQQRTLVLRSDGSQVSYTLLRGASPSLGDADLTPAPAAQHALNATVAALVAPNGGEAVDQGQQLAQFGIGFVLLPAPVNQNLARLLDGVAGLQRVSATSAFAVWRVSELPARVRVVEATGTVVGLPSGPTGMSGVSAPAAGGTLELAEPACGWEATLNGKPLAPVASSAGSWAQAFRLPPGGGMLEIGHTSSRP